MMIAIIDYDAGNLRSVAKALDFLGEQSVVTRKRDEILSADKVILPGVGSFGDAMSKLHEYDLVRVINEVADMKKPLLGICLGLQLLFESSEESKGAAGLGILKGKILKIPDCEGLKIPHMGWNSIDIKPNATLFKNICRKNLDKDVSLGDDFETKLPYVYFVHSYYLKAENKDIIAATTEYSTHIHASVEKDNIFACQFHPEKSGVVGLRILKNFADYQPYVK